MGWLSRISTVRMISPPVSKTSQPAASAVNAPPLTLRARSIHGPSGESEDCTIMVMSVLESVRVKVRENFPPSTPQRGSGTMEETIRISAKGILEKVDDAVIVDVREIRGISGIGVAREMSESPLLDGWARRPDEVDGGACLLKRERTVTRGRAACGIRANSSEFEGSGDGGRIKHRPGSRQIPERIAEIHRASHPVERQIDHRVVGDRNNRGVHLVEVDAGTRVGVSAKLPCKMAGGTEVERTAEADDSDSVAGLQRAVDIRIGGDAASAREFRRGGDGYGATGSETAIHDQGAAIDAGVAGPGVGAR